MKRFFLTATFAMFVLLLCAQTTDYPIVQIDGKNYYSYTVVPKDGLYAIARKFGVSQADLHNCNPNLSEGLKIGQVLLVPVVEKVRPDTISTEFILHQVQPKQTLYALSRKYNVTISDLLKYNPELADGLKVGQQLKIPKQSFTDERRAETIQPIQNPAAAILTVRKHVVQKNETLYGISRQYGITVEDLVEVNNITTTIKVGDELLIPDKETEHAPTPSVVTVLPDTVVPVVADVVTPVVDTVKIVAAPNPNALKIAVLLPFMLKTPYIDASVNYFWEFYRGVLIGLEDVKRAGISVELYTYDIEKSLALLDSVLHCQELTAMDLIIGPAYANQVQAVADFAQKHHIYALVPFTSKIDAEANNFLLQFNPSQERMLPIVAQTIVKRFPNQRFVIARVSDKRDKANLLADELTKKLHEARKTYDEIVLTQHNVDTLQKLVGRNRALLFLATQRVDLVENLLPQIKALELPFLQIWGFDDWKQWTQYYDGTYFYSLFNQTDTDAYEARYRTWFGNHTCETNPHYDLIGYDVINYMTKMLTINKENPTAAFKHSAYQGLQSDFSFEQNGSKQWINTNWYLFGFYNRQLHNVK
ncbi:MAG: LysM peptidoglycan-binding domain-containing protein [Paludibacteraceae bacterium]